MGKTNFIIAVMGLGSCIILSLMMHRLLNIKQDKDLSNIGQEVRKSYGGRLLAEPKFEVKSHRVGARQGHLTIQPRLPSAGPRLARDIGRFVWTLNSDRFDQLVVVVKHHAEDQGKPFEIPPPYNAKKDKTEPAPVSNKAPTKKAASRKTVPRKTAAPTAKKAKPSSRPTAPR